MFLGELIPREDTQLGKELIQRGEERGEARGEARGLTVAMLAFLQSRHGAVPEPIRQRLQGLSLENLQALMPQVYQGLTLEQLEAWLTAHPA